MYFCEFCEAELDYEDSYGTKDYIIYGDIKGKNGEIFRCPNHQGFENKEDAIEYAKNNNLEYKDDLWEEIVCESSAQHVSGSYYTDRDGNLHLGYPC
jgi:hypothetical protein